MLFARNGARHYVARSEFKQRMIALHEALAFVVAQVSAFAAKRFREQKAGSAGEQRAVGWNW